MSPRPIESRCQGLTVMCCLVALVCLPGCGKENSNLVPVEGTVMLGATVLATDAHTKGTVVLYPDKSKGNDSLEIPRGFINSEGKFKILTGMKEGAAPGWYRVTVDAAKVLDPKNPYHTASGFLMPIHYTDKDTSNLAFKVVERPVEGAYDIKLDSK